MTAVEHAIALIATLHPHPSSSPPILLIQMSVRTAKNHWVHQWFLDPVEAALWALQHNLMGLDAYVAVNPRMWAGRSIELAVAHVVALVMDLDRRHGADAAAVIGRLTEFEIPPSIIVESGGGTQLYLLLAEPAACEQAKIIGKRLCRFGGPGSDGVANVNRVLRLPGSWNYRDRAHPTASYVVELHADRRYHLATVDAALDRMGEPPAEPTRNVRPAEPTDPPLGIDDLFARLTEDERAAIITGQRPARWTGGDVSPSGTDWRVTCALVRASATDDQIRWLFACCAIGAGKFRVLGRGGDGYLERTIRSARRALGTPVPEPDAVPAVGAPTNGVTYAFTTAAKTAVRWIGIPAPPRHEGHQQRSWPDILGPLPALPPWFVSWRQAAGVVH